MRAEYKYFQMNKPLKNVQTGSLFKEITGGYIPPIQENKPRPGIQEHNLIKKKKREAKEVQCLT